MGINISETGNTLGRLGYRAAQVGIYVPVAYLGVKAAIAWYHADDNITALRKTFNSDAKTYGAVAWVAMHALAGIVGSLALAARGSASITAARLGKVAPFFGLASIVMTVFWALQGPNLKQGGGSYD